MNRVNNRRDHYDFTCPECGEVILAKELAVDDVCICPVCQSMLLREISGEFVSEVNYNGGVL